MYSSIKGKGKQRRIERTEKKKKKNERRIIDAINAHCNSHGSFTAEEEFNKQIACS